MKGGQLGPDPSYVIGEVQLLRGTDTPENIARRVGYRDRRNLARQLARWGRGDLAMLFDTKALT